MLFLQVTLPSELQQSRLTVRTNLHMTPSNNTFSSEWWSSSLRWSLWAWNHFHILPALEIHTQVPTCWLVHVEEGKRNSKWIGGWCGGAWVHVTHQQITVDTVDMMLILYQSAFNTWIRTKNAARWRHVHVTCRDTDIEQFTWSPYVLRSSAHWHMHTFLFSIN